MRRHGKGEAVDRFGSIVLAGPRGVGSERGSELVPALATLPRAPPGCLNERGWETKRKNKRNVQTEKEYSAKFWDSADPQRLIYLLRWFSGARISEVVRRVRFLLLRAPKSAHLERSAVTTL